MQVQVSTALLFGLTACTDPITATLAEADDTGSATQAEEDEGWSAPEVMGRDLAGLAAIYSTEETSEIITYTPDGEQLSALSVNRWKCNPIALTSPEARYGRWPVISELGVYFVEERGDCEGIAIDADMHLLTAGISPAGNEIYALTWDRLWRVGLDGARELVAHWNADYTGAAADFDLLAVGMDVAADGTVGIFDNFGGFATWSEEDGLVFHARVDLEAYDGAVTVAGAAGIDGWATLVQDDDQTQIRTWTGEGWARATTIRPSDFTPTDLLGAFILDGEAAWIATVEGGWYSSIWRVDPSGEVEALTWQTADGDFVALAPLFADPEDE